MANEEFIISTLKEHPELREQAIDLIEESLGYKGRSYKFTDDFKELVHPENSENQFILINGNKKIISHIGLCKRNLLYKGFKAPVLFWGGICTHKQFRGQGIFSNFFKDLLNLHSDLAALSILWSSLGSTYKKLGFVEAGTINTYNGHHRVNLESFPISLLKQNERDWIKQKYNELQNKFICVEREDSHWNRLFNHQSLKVFQKESIIGLVGKGLDLQNVVFEYYPPEGMSLLLNSQFSVWDSLQQHEVNDRPTVIYNGLFRIHCNNHFKNFVEHITNQQITILGLHPESVEFSHEGHIYKLSHKDFVNGLWGPEFLTEFRQFTPSLFISGADSI